nr:NADH dehydrogenase subunit 2 [Microrhagus sp. ZM-2022]
MAKVHKMLFFLIVISSTLITISSYSWLGLWVGLEINLLSLIPLMLSPSNSLSTESTIKYFITQAMASMILFIAILVTMSQGWTILEKFPHILVLTALLTKMGAAPFHFWFPDVMVGVEWIPASFILTWQKIAPMTLISYFEISSLIMGLVILSCMVISGVFLINQTSMKKILTFSSINNIGWMLMSIQIQEKVWILYLTVYIISTLVIILFLASNKIEHMAQMMNKPLGPTLNKFTFSLNFFNLASIPPFIMFLPKWLIVEEMMISQDYFMPTSMILLTLISTYMYLQILSGLLLSSTTSKSSKKENSNLIFKVINFMALISLAPTTFLFNKF